MRAGDFVGAKIYRKPTEDKRTKKDGTPRSPKKLGKIHFPVFTPGGTRVVGFMVRQSDIAGMIERPDRFVALDAIGVYEGAIAVDDVKGTYDAAAAKRLDINLDDCIIWVGMDVRTESGDAVGYCSDVEFKPRSGIVQTFYVTASAASSMLVGDTQVPPTMLRGYENGAMIVSDEVKSLGYSGGAAAKAAEASVVVGDKVKKGAKVLDDKGSVAVDKGSRALGKQLGIAFLVTVGGYASAMSGSAMAVAIGYALQAPPLVLFSLATVGYAANALGSVTLSGGKGAGGPLAVLFIAVIAAELGKAVSKETKIDILVTPLVTILAGVGLSALLAPAIGTAASAVGDVVKWATVLQPFWMGILVSVVIGVALTLPISSAAICAAIGLTGLAGGAAVAGCCANMVGFAVLSFRENRWGGLVSQGLGTSMLQMGNIVRNPRIWLPAILTSAITGPLATCLFRLEMNDPASAVASGMGTCGMVGPIGVYAGWVNDVATGAKAAITSLDWVGLALICFVLPSAYCALFSSLARIWVLTRAMSFLTSLKRLGLSS